ncbi:MAG: Sensory transduction protein LytR [Saprospiraceae bacterium]|jgi:two-component system LytT family response regulator|nr:response regulator transcription factor [Saprospiraceae bacterium]MBV6473505.1 Sensory transduction protein LytR [Saprospiraceae bacterium]
MKLFEVGLTLRSEMALRCLVVDDDPLVGDLLRHFCDKSGQVSFCIVASTALDGLNILAGGGIDLVFLDYHLPDMKGQEFLERMPHALPVVMVTSEADFAAKSYDYDLVVDFLVKPLQYDRFARAVGRVSPVTAAAHPGPVEAIFIKDGSKLVRVELEKLLYIKSEGNYSSFVSESGQFLSLISMKELEQKLPPNFVRTHRSYIVNIKRIQVIQADGVTVGGKELPVGEKYKAELMGKIREW